MLNFKQVPNSYVMHNLLQMVHVLTNTTVPVHANGSCK